MPCRDGGYRDEEEELRRKLDEVTNLLCGLCKKLELKGQLPLSDSDLMIWYHKHKKMDAEREAEEAKEKAVRERKKKVLEKLTKEERKTLGLF